LVVEHDRGGEAAEAGDDPLAQALKGARTVTFEGEDVLCGPDDRFDPLADRREMRPLRRPVLRAGVRGDLACEAGVVCPAATGMGSFRRTGRMNVTPRSLTCAAKSRPA
jgi:hypothetical protein